MTNENPYAPPLISDPFPEAMADGRLKPHRGTKIVIFAALAWSLFFAFGIAAWVMARRDMKEMEAGIMDRSGYTLTKVGYILGITATLFAGFVVTIAIVAAVLIR
jgi:hypothetical protein